MAVTEICPTQNSLPKRSFETEKYKAYVCLGDKENELGYFVRVTKGDGSKITVPLVRKNGETYIARNDETSYVISLYEMLIQKRGKTVLRERVNSAIAANGTSLTSACPQGENILQEAVTRSFIVYICGNDKPGSYVGIARIGNEKITLPLANFQENNISKNKQYVAIEGNTRYSLNRDVFKVIQGNQITIKEKVLRWL
ncbi:MAG: hypothetical protein HC903_20355 [Methylacidiphilales bacterium]|nr:hypothetical protein [Candidatus Methylacidiphilales bacterium]NJR17316.1 hypothetical protein [Calothrix sp. CSU_2_0]